MLLKKLIFAALLSGFFYEAAAQLTDIQPSVYKVPAKECNVITHFTGTEILIPKDAFQLPEKSSCDSVTIKYREFHSQADMAVAKIPMTFRQNGKDHLLESGGMFEIFTECNGKEVKLAAGKQIQVRFKSRAEVKDLQAFYFNRQTTAWEKIQTPVVDFSYSDTAVQQWGNLPPKGSANYEVVEVQVDESDPFITLNDTVYWGKFQTGIFKGMSISKMGLYNYDRIIEDEKQVYFSADVRLPGSSFPVEGTVYVAYKELNSVIYFTTHQLKEKFWLLPRHDLIMFAILKDGTVATLPEEKVKQLDFQKLPGISYKFELVPLEKAADKQKLAQLTGISN